MLYSQKELHHAEVFISEVLESHRVPDIYSWRINKLGKLIPEKDDTPIEDIIVTNNPIAEIEWRAFEKIQSRAPLMEDGDYFLWISLIHPIYYPDTSKIIISRKTGDAIVNTSINTDWDVIGGILAAQEFATLSDLNENIFKSANDVRGNPIFINKNHDEELGLAFKKILDQKSMEMMSNGQAIAVKKNYINDYLAGKSVSYGNNPLSCPPKMPFKIFSGEYWRKGDCRIPAPECGKKNVDIGPCGVCKECEKKFDENPNYAAA